MRTRIKVIAIIGLLAAFVGCISSESTDRPTTPLPNSPFEYVE